MYATKLHKLVVTTALALAALGAAPFASAGTGAPQRHPDSRATIIGVLTHPEIIGVLKHPERFLGMRKAGGDPK